MPLLPARGDPSGTSPPGRLTCSPNGSLMLSLIDADQPEPSPGDLAAIDAEWPLIDAELAVLDAEIAMLYAADRGGPSPMDWRRLRRAEAAVTRTAAALLSRPTTASRRAA